MRKATALLALLLLMGVCYPNFVVTPDEDRFELLQNSSVTRIYVLKNNDTVGTVDVSTSVAWVDDTTDYINVTPGKDYTAKVTFSVGMMAPGEYNVLIRFSGETDSQNVLAKVTIVRTSWIYAYLLNEETHNDITYANVSTEQGEYSLVRIKGEDSLLIKNSGEIVKDAGEIRHFYEAYYKETIYPGDEEIEELKRLVREFNNSRNKQTQFGPAEHTCKQYTGMNENPCYDTHSCELACSALVELCGPAMGALGPPFVNALVEFGTLTTGMSEDYESFLGNVSGMEYSNVGMNMGNAYDSIVSMKSAADTLLYSKLRYDLSCMDCYGICPSMEYNMTAIDDAADKVTEISNRIKPIETVSEKADELLQSTKDRITQAVGREHRNGYMERYGVIEEIHGNLTARFENATTHTYSPELEEKFGTLTNASETLSWFIDHGDYSDISKLDADFDSYVDRFYSAKGEVEALIESVSGVYENVYDIRQNASVYLLKAEMNVQPGDSSLAKVEELRMLLQELDDNFTLPLEAADAPALERGYVEVGERAKEIAESKPSTSIIGRIISKIVRTEKDPVLAFVGLFRPLTLSERTFVSENIAPAIAGAAIALLTLVMLISLAAYMIRNRRQLSKRRRTIVMYSMFCAATLLVAGLSVGTFYYLVKVYGGERTLNFFVFQVNKAGSAAVLVDAETAGWSPNPGETLSTMEGCGNSIAQAFPDYSIRVYVVDRENCSVSGMEMNYTDCDREFATLPIVYVRYGKENRISFRTLYAVNATIEGDGTYLEACPLAKALR